MTRWLSPGRVAVFHLAVLGVFAVALSTAEIWPLRIVYNASASVPLGWYAVTDADGVKPGDIVVARPPARVEPLLVERSYLGRGVPFLKHVAAGEGAEVCRLADRVSVDGSVIAAALQVDGHGRALPRWSGCRRLGPGEVLLVNRDATASFDGRYFGPTLTRDIVGKARPLWIW